MLKKTLDLNIDFTIEFRIKLFSFKTVLDY